MNKLLLKVGALAFALSSIIPATMSPAAAQSANLDQNRARIELCRELAANSNLDSPQFGNCVGFVASFPNALPAQVCKYWREIGIIPADKFNECVARLKEQGA